MKLPIEFREAALLTELAKRAAPAKQCVSDAWRCHPGIIFVIICAVIIGVSFIYWFYRLYKNKEVRFNVQSFFLFSFGCCCLRA